MKGYQLSTHAGKIEWLLRRPDDWAMIAHSERWLPTPSERINLNALVDKAVADGLYSPKTFRRDVQVSLYRAIQHAWAIKRDREP